MPQPGTGIDVTATVRDDTGHVAESAPREPETASAFAPTSLRNLADTGTAKTPTPTTYARRPRRSGMVGCGDPGEHAK